MRKLERPQSPACLERYRAERTWGILAKKDTQEIWDALDTMQRELCAYCEREISATTPRARHIEHFKPRSTHPHEAFIWENLFGACNDNNFCARFKDSPKCPQYNIEDLVKPDVESPSTVLKFLANGVVKPQDGLDIQQRNRALKTIEVLRLNHQTLIARRRRVFEDDARTGGSTSIHPTIDTLSELLDTEPFEQLDDIRMMILKEIDKIRFTACSAALRSAYLELLELCELRKQCESGA